VPDATALLQDRLTEAPQASLRHDGHDTPRIIASQLSMMRIISC